ncbi:lytic murein transglycosylase [Jannaschia donghaensis]|uniref:Membrane-bound lytic murein transglycosylase B n=1 Tax=Jannaschia donghaensis TaxID=420998 RepID=A0A0M6YF89_9RHOB|nr:lytic murein transglycosylase [Jannaschia donghaensis]CTQ48345.1 Membrane-bound lytic murein transglycosylase B precursor [Jannaschia donghaensis]
MRLILALIVLTLPAAAQQDSSRPPARPVIAAAVDFDTWVRDFRPRALAAGITDATFNAAMAGVEMLPDVLRRDANQSEFTKTIWDYLDTAVSDLRISNGRAAIARHADALTRIEADFGVDKHVVAAIWGLESSYGAFRGSISTLSALATLAAGSRRAAFFEEQLIEGLRILQDGDTTRAAFAGSWAGASGHTQFMPTSFRDHAVDFTGDGRRDLWGDDPTDALASTAAYLKANGWTTGQPWGTEVVLPDGFDYLLTGERVEKSPAEWADLGIRTPGGAPLPNGGPASIRVPAGHEGVAFMTFANFRVIETYNTADAYVIGVGHLGDRLAGGPALQSEWPRQDRALSYEERIELQLRLRDAGFDPLKIDAKIGPDTLDAIQRWQVSLDLVPDGYVDPDLLNRLRDETEGDRP